MNANVFFEDGDLTFKAKAENNGQPTYKTITDANGVIVDYQDVIIAGYAATFDVDRDGEQITPSAFDKGLKPFLKNPVMLVDHVRDVAHMAGSYSVTYADNKGLFVEGKLSNSPHVKHTRFLVVEGHLKTLSIAGRFKMSYTDAKTAQALEVEVREISLVVVPANEKALFKVKTSFDESGHVLEAKSPENKGFKQKSGESFLSISDNQIKINLKGEN